MSRLCSKSSPYSPAQSYSIAAWRSSPHFLYSKLPP
uniref:Uncharacterized protein n=1 Tax=Rhizophora mucronata TaxID=61149 RepID=A0A2P2P2U1_RHIMU